MFEIYVVKHRRTNEVLYVGQGAKGNRARHWNFPSNWRRRGASEHPIIDVIGIVKSRKDALFFEAKLISALSPRWNKARWGTYGGLKRRNSEETRKKISLAARGRIPWNKGKHIEGHLNSPETRLKISLALRGKKRRPHTEAEKRKVSLALRGRIFTKEHRMKLSAAGRLRDYSSRIKPPRPCINCKELSKPTRHGRCSKCRTYFDYHGTERPV